MTRRYLCAVLFAAILLAGCDTTGAAPTPQPGFTDQPTAAATQQPESGQPANATAYPLLPTSVPAVVQGYPTPDPNQLPAVAPGYPTPDAGSGSGPTAAPATTPDSGSGGRPTAAPAATPKP